MTNALGMAWHNRQLPGSTVIHSDHGVQLTSWASTERAKESGLLPSMGSIGDCYYNAMITTANAATAHWGCSLRPSMKGST